MRKVDSVVKLNIDIQRDLFAHLFLEDRPVRLARRIPLESLDSWNSILGDNWNRRIINCKGDFAYVTPGTVSYWIRLGKPLEEYSPEGALQLTHKGFVFHLQFVRGLGNKYDYEQLMF